METSVYTVHTKPGQDLIAISDGFSLFALAFPIIWALWHRLWGVFCAIILIMLAVALIAPLGVAPAMYGVALILAFEGGEIKRLERGFFGWQEVGMVQAGSEEGAEELFLNGQVA